MSAPHLDDLLTPRVSVGRAAKYLGTSPRHVQRLIAARELPALDVSREGSRRPTWAIRVSDLRAWLVRAEARSEKRLAEALARAHATEPERSDTSDRGGPGASRSAAPRAKLEARARGRGR
jgi:excisionase family DNA binding protein